MTTNTILKAIHGAVKAGLGLAVCCGLAALFGGCKDTVSSKPCACPSGKVHPSAPCNCGGDNCQPSHCNLFDLGNNKVLEDKTGLLTQLDINAAKTIVNNLSVNGDFARFNKIIVESGAHPSSAPYGSGADGEITIKIGSFSSTGNLTSAIFDGYNDAVAYMMNNFNIRLANAQPVITPRAQVAWGAQGRVRTGA
jgi:hypothetical protein